MKKPKSSLTSFLRISVGGIVFLGLITSSTISGEGAAYETTPLSKDFFEGTSPKSDRSARDMSRDKMKKIKEVPEMEATTPSDLKRMTRRQALKEMDPEGPCQRFVLDVPLRNEFEFYSPGYGPDQPYPNRTDCIKTIEAPPGHLLRLDFRDEFHLEQSEQCRFDSLEIRDGAHGYSNLVGTFCGNKHPPPITSSDRYLWLRFTSDENIQYSGFHAVYWYIPRPTSSDQHPELDRCEFLINGSDGFANRSDIDENRTRLAVTYGLPLDCMWIITVQEGWKIMLQFVDFKLVKPNDCDSNFVDVFSDRTDLPSRLKNFCGSIADSVTSKSNVLHLRFFAEARSVNSTFSTLFTAFREKKKDESCTAEEYDCEDATCISIDLKCNQRINCRFRWDEDECQPKIGVFASVLESEHIIIILVVFCLILSGMCFAFLFNCTRKLVRDHRIIQEHIRQSRENEVDGVGRKERRSTFQATLQKITTLSTHGRSRSGSSSGGGSLQREVVKNGIKRDMTGDRSVSPAKKHFPETGECYVPVDDVIPILDRGGEEGGGGGGDEGGDAGDQEPEEFFPAPETKDSECQTRESLFSSRPADFDGESDGSPTPPPPPPPPPSAVRIPTAENGRRGKPRTKNDFVSEVPPFSTFGYGRDRLGGYGDEKRYRAEAVIEMDDRKGEKRDSSANPDPYDVRPFSVDSTKSAPDVIVTH